ncbi:hypothetical protein H0H92_002486 [Tricholoma furcatifolium]|nr:hypothetical protein H0H92_002486 [Tricholoma furcatifolium]
MPLLRRRKSVIAGSITLMLLNPWTFDADDIDFYVPSSQAQAFIDDLKNEYALEVVFCSKDHDYIQIPGAQAVYTLRNQAFRFNVVVSYHENPLLPITFFHSSAVFNYISAFEVYVGYPRLTFAFQNLINSSVFRIAESKHALESQVLCLAKYFRRGYYFAAELYGWPELRVHVCREHMECPKTNRRFRDGGGRRFLLHNIAPGALDLPVPYVEVPEVAWDLFD